MDNALKETLNNIFEQQKKFFASGATRSIDFRKSALEELKQSILNEKEALYTALDADLGKSREECDRSEMGVVISEIDYALAHLEEWDTEETAPVDDYLKPAQFKIKQEPFGVSYIIGPFNYPVNLTFSPLVGAIASGCTAIVKPSENTPETAAVLERIIKSVFNSDYIHAVQGAVEENSFLLSLPFDFFFFTGSPKVGKIVMKAAAEHLTPVVLELGGKCPVIVCSDADLDQSVRNICRGKFANSGQTCVAPDYLLVDSSIKSEFLQRLLVYIKQHHMPIGKIGKIVSKPQAERIQSLIEKTKGDIKIGGHADVENRLVEPTVVDNVDWDDALMQEELFGPVLPVISFDELHSVAGLVNQHHPKPLGAYIFSKNYVVAEEILDTIPSGDAQINDVVYQAASNTLPFGGVGNSGMGEYHGIYSYQAFSHKKSIIIRE